MNLSRQTNLSVIGYDEERSEFSESFSAMAACISAFRTFLRIYTRNYGRPRQSRSVFKCKYPRVIPVTRACEQDADKDKRNIKDVSLLGARRSNV